ncbi:hypothetical protein LSH36_80g04002 [Paralvinella palmiformis]|uniref:Uncharacterized protein n=1 Tax=Paralvinella palmiformis TaxID=53620 RepID=A0AAD9K1Y3_9ANNE|nr:hypothetical protein LSH36_80g04002 [Paralvinella palmiformis]
MEDTKKGMEVVVVQKYVDNYWGEIVKIWTAMGQTWFLALAEIVCFRSEKVRINRKTRRLEHRRDGFLAGSSSTGRGKSVSERASTDHSGELKLRVKMADFEENDETPNSTRASNYHRLVIIGAGISGVAAGHDLIEAGFTDFVIVEASDRIGGRIRSIDVNGEFLSEIRHHNSAR